MNPLCPHCGHSMAGCKPDCPSIKDSGDSLGTAACSRRVFYRATFKDCLVNSMELCADIPRGIDAGSITGLGIAIEKAERITGAKVSAIEVTEENDPDGGRRSRSTD